MLSDCSHSWRSRSVIRYPDNTKKMGTPKKPPFILPGKMWYRITATTAKVRIPSNPVIYLLFFSRFSIAKYSALSLIIPVKLYSLLTKLLILKRCKINLLAYKKISAQRFRQAEISLFNFYLPLITSRRGFFGFWAGMIVPSFSRPLIWSSV